MYHHPEPLGQHYSEVLLHPFNCSMRLLKEGSMGWVQYSTNSILHGRCKVPRTADLRQHGCEVLWWWPWPISVRPNLLSKNINLNTEGVHRLQIR